MVSLRPWVLYRIVHRGGIRVRKDPNKEADEDSPTYDYLEVIKAEANSELMNEEGVLIKLFGSEGWAFKQYGKRLILEKVENADSLNQDLSDESEEFPLWFKVNCPDGLLVQEDPDPDSPSSLVLFLNGKVFEASEKITRSAHSFLKLASNEGYVLFESLDNKFCEICHPPSNEIGEWWVQVLYAGGVRVRLAPRLHAPLSGLQIECGMVFKAIRKFIKAGAEDCFLGLNISQSPDEEVLGWVPIATRDVQVLGYCEKNLPKEGNFVFQAIDPEVIAVQSGPHLNATNTAFEISPYSVFKADQVMVYNCDSAKVAYAHLEDKRGWVKCSEGSKNYLSLLRSFPNVIPKERCLRIDREDELIPHLGPCFESPLASQEEKLEKDEIYVSTVEWKIPAKTRESDAIYNFEDYEMNDLSIVDDICWAYIDEKGWVCLHSGQFPDKVAVSEVESDESLKECEITFDLRWDLRCVWEVWFKRKSKA
eukprot:CAMPEP_0171456486 /NCGR_PEP_ID=MMETSP0945-20130129/2951_1 /TAXON_ID=109269 /ORGANISM="Vaucheria litorea, Strain CCMP2940" /LENGTH=479 /DNA_ID=CAMNT_0011981915 /DNA_START=293 /DNA_END=1730 /DNA_ORIENTATION=+